MESVLTQLPALLGVLVGTIGTMVATTVTERARWRRSQNVRWDERRLDAYADFTRAVKEVHLVSLGMLSGHRPGSRTPTLDREDGLARLAEADVRHTLTWEAVLLLGDATTVRAASTWRHAVRNLEQAARSLQKSDSSSGSGRGTHASGSQLATRTVANAGFSGTAKHWP